MSNKNKQNDKESVSEPLAIVGIACQFPKANSVANYWSNIKEGVDAITDVPDSHWNPEDYFDTDKSKPDMTYARRGGFIDPIDFDPLLYGMSPNNIEATDTTQLLGMVVARQALLDAGYSTDKENSDGRPFDRDRTSVILGVTGTLELVIPLGARLGHPLWRKALKEAGVKDSVAAEVVTRISESYVPWQENSFPGLLGNVAAGRIANRFDLGGTNCVVDAACASSFSAIHLAAMELQTGRCDMAITGGLDTFNDIFMYMCFSKTPALSPTGNSRPFHIDGDGTILGEGLGVLILKRLADAKRDEDKIYAIIKGIGSSSDGRGNAIYAPSANGQQKALNNAYQQAGISPHTIELVEAHGTGTKVGDAVEVESLANVFRRDQDQGTWCAIGSVKSMIGHTKAAAGAAGLIKIALALQHKVLPPSIKVDEPLDVLSPGRAPVYVNTIKRPWLDKQEHPRRAAVSAFGFGGSNFHCVLEEAETDKTEIEWDGRVILFSFSDDSVEGLQLQINEIDTEQNWDELRHKAARSLQHYDPTQDYRLVLVVERSKTDLANLIIRVSDKLIAHPTTSWNTPDGAYFGFGNARGKLALLFPGQGSQYVGMLRDLACQFPQLLSALKIANAEFEENEHGKRLSDRIYPVPVFTEIEKQEQEAALRSTAIAQPAIGAVSLGAWHVVNHFGIKADAAAGHSFGELTALYSAGCFDENSLSKLAKKRGELMQIDKGNRGAMLVVIAPAVDIDVLIKQEQLDVIIANYNAPNQVVLSGAMDQIEQAQQLLNQKSIHTKLLPVSAAFHSRLVADAETPFAEFLDSIEFKHGLLPVFSNTTAQSYPSDPVKDRQLLAGQLARPVEFIKQIQTMYDEGINTFIEIGPSSVLTGLVNSILAEHEHHAIALDASKGKKHGQFELACLLAQLSTLGYDCDLYKWDSGYLDKIDKKAEKNPGLTIKINGANYVTPRQKSAPTVKNSSAEAISTSQSNLASPQFNEALRATQQSILSLQKMQEQTAQLHKQYLQGQEQAQQTIRQLLEQQQYLLTGQPIPQTTIASENIPEPPHVEANATAVSTDSVVSVPEPVSTAPTDTAVNDTSETLISVDDNHYQNVLLEVVAEKTGYPIEMLSLDMSLDTDLGIDSIKRVEILSALQEKLPGMQAIEPEELGTFQLLQHIVEYLAVGESSDKPRIKTQPTASTETTVTTDNSTFSSILLEVVAEKTGYPVDMLHLDMNLDSDLGIDSIKRVEILSALQERLPDAPAVSPEDLGTLQTLRQIVDYMQSAQSPGNDTQNPTTATAQITDTDKKTICRYKVELTTLIDETPRQVISLPENALVWVVDDGSQLCRQICKALEKQNLRTQTITLHTELNGTPSALFIVAPTDVDATFIEDTFRLIQKTSTGLRETNQHHKTILAAVTRMGGYFGLSDMSDTDPLAAGLAGLIKTADKEWPEVSCKIIDIPDVTDNHVLAITIADELLSQGPLEVGINADGRSVLTLQEAESDNTAKQTPVLFSKDDTLIISGGARGVTAEIAFSLAQAYQSNIVLLGRSPEPQQEPEWLSALKDEAAIKQAIMENNTSKKYSPKQIENEYQSVLANREIHNNLQRIKTTGANVYYRSVDIRDTDTLNLIVDDIRAECGPITALIHGAGVLADRLIEDKTLEQWRQVFSTKVDGLKSLLNAIGKDKLKLLALFSSTTARFGRKGQSDYAAANEVLNKLAQQQTLLRPDCKVLSINWGPWEGGMVTPQLKKIFAAEGVGLIPLQTGADYFIQEITRPGPVEVVVLGSPLSTAINTANTDNGSINTPLQLAFERKLNIEDYPVLKSHVINGNAVLPMALILEWLAHGAMHNNPGMLFLGLNDLNIFKGIILKNGVNYDVQILAGQLKSNGGTDVVPVELRSGSVLHASAEIVLGTDYVRQIPSDAAIPTGEYPYKNSECYNTGQLFHGPDLHGIESIGACSESGITGQIKTAPAPSKWVAQPIRSTWLADPLILDASFQMMILWGFYCANIGSLPTGINRYRQFQHKFPKSNVDVIIRIEKTSKHSTRAMIEFIDNKKNLIARIDGYECVADASLNKSFSRNKIETQSQL